MLNITAYTIKMRYGFIFGISNHALTTQRSINYVNGLLCISEGYLVSITRIIIRKKCSKGPNLIATAWMDLIFQTHFYQTFVFPALINYIQIRQNWKIRTGKRAHKVCHALWLKFTSCIVK